MNKEMRLSATVNFLRKQRYQKKLKQDRFQRKEITAARRAFSATQQETLPWFAGENLEEEATVENSFQEEKS